MSENSLNICHNIMEDAYADSGPYAPQIDNVYKFTYNISFDNIFKYTYNIFFSL